MLKMRAFGQDLLNKVMPLCLVAFVAAPLRAQIVQNPPAKPATAPPAQRTPLKPAPASTQEEGEALEQAFTSASGNPQALINNLEDFLARFPESPRREQVLRTILKEALQSNEPRTAAAVAEKLLALTPGDPGLLSTLVDLLDQQNDAVSREKGIHYSTLLIERAEKMAAEPRPANIPAERWPETQALVRSTGYLLRARNYAKSGENEKAVEDYENSYRAHPTSLVAERLGDLAAKLGKNELAIDEYATAFAFPDKNVDPARRDQLRRKLGSLYVAKHHSEKGLGDLLLAHYDQLMLTLKSRFAPPDEANSGTRDPFDYVLKRPEGPAVRLAEYRGKVLVMDFWATWCGPCRVEGKLLERVMGSFRSEPGVAFLAVNVDEERDSVPRYIKEEGWTVPVVYGQGLDHLLGVRALPTLMIFDREGRVVFRQVGVDPSKFTETIEKIVRAALGARASSSSTSP